MPKRKRLSRSRPRRIKLTTDLRMLQIIIFCVLVAFAFLVISFIIQIYTPNPSKTGVIFPSVVLTEADLLINTSDWKTYNSQGISLKYPRTWTVEENSSNLGPKMGTHTFFGPTQNSSLGIALFVTNKIVPGEWINKVYAPNFINQAEAVSKIQVAGVTAIKTLNLPYSYENELVFITNNDTTYILYVRGNSEEIKIFDNLLRTVKFI